jgi:hypothetical protein
MAISLTTLNGTDSIAASRITINDNFSTLSSAVNLLTSIINISTGLIDNTSFSANINTSTLNATSISVSSGNISTSSGNLILGGYVEFGNASGIQIKKLSKNSGTFTALDLSGATGSTYTGTISYVGLPKATTVNIKSIQNPELGAFVYDITQNVLAYCKGTTSTAGGTGTWYKISTTGATAL